MIPVDKERLSFLVLDYNRPNELKQTLESIRLFCKVDHQIIVHANGGEQSYHLEYYRDGLIDKLILNKFNNGAGYGCSDLFNYCNTDWACYLEGDQPLVRPLEKDEFNRWKYLYNTNDKIRFVSLVGLATAGNFSQRAFFTNVHFYRELSKQMPNGGPGFYKDLDTNEHFVQEYIMNKGLELFLPRMLVMDLGCYSVNSNPDDSVWLHRTDTRQVWLVKGPVKEKWNYPNFNDAEWDKVLAFQEWEDGEVPTKDKPHSFLHWKGFDDLATIKALRNKI